MDKLCGNNRGVERGEEVYMEAWRAGKSPRDGRLRNVIFVIDNTSASYYQYKFLISIDSLSSRFPCEGPAANMSYQ